MPYTIKPYLLDKEKTYIAHSLAYALKTIKTLSPTEKRLIISEFFHSLNRKGLIPNDEVEPYINMTLTFTEE